MFGTRSALPTYNDETQALCAFLVWFSYAEQGHQPVSIVLLGLSHMPQSECLNTPRKAGALFCMRQKRGLRDNKSSCH